MGFAEDKNKEELIKKFHDITWKKIISEESLTSDDIEAIRAYMNQDMKWFCKHPEWGAVMDKLLKELEGVLLFK